jgi:hypothetical protein
MHLGRRAYAGSFRRFAAQPAFLVFIAAIVVLGLVGGPSLLMPTHPSTVSPTDTSTSAATSGNARTAGPTPDQDPYIYSFTATPAYLFGGNATVLQVGVSDPDPVNYFYESLPDGCFSSNTSSLSCTPDATFGTGTFTITVLVSDYTNPFFTEQSSDSLTLTVYPGSPELANQAMFSVNPDVIPNLNASDATCQSIASPPFYQNFCYPEAQNPTLLSLSNGHIGLATQLYTDLTANTCAGATKATVARIGFSVSQNGGASFGPAVTLGNNTCQYLDAIEPSFAVSSTDVFGAFIEENSSVYAAEYTSRGTDAIGFVASTNNGVGFGPARTILTGGSFAHPQVAAHGTYVYVVYEQIANSTHAIGGGVLPIETLFLVSSNSGASFTGPFRVPGLNPSEGYNAMSPAVAVNATGTLAIAYATNRTCLAAGPLGSCNAYGDSVVVVTSNAHGAGLKGPYVVAKGAGETPCYTGSCLPGFFESTPQISIAYSPSGLDLYVAYAATYAEGHSLPLTQNSPTGVFAAISSDAGVLWTSGAIAAPLDAPLVRSYDPGLGVSAHGVYVTYSQANASGGLWGFADSLSQWWDSAPLGTTLSWTVPSAINIDSFAASGGSVNATRLSYSGDSSSVAFTGTGTPLAAFAIPQSPVTTTATGSGYYYVNTSYETDMAVGSLLSAGGAGTVSIVFMETQLPLGATWSFTMNGVNYVLTVPAIQFNNLPADAPVIDGAAFQPGFWEIITTFFNATIQEYSFSQTVIYTFDVWVGIEFDTFPGGIGPWIPENFGEFEVEAVTASTPYPTFIEASSEIYMMENFMNGTFTEFPVNELDYYSPFGGYFNTCDYALCPYPTPWYYPIGSTLTLNITEIAYDQPPPVYWTGQGDGSYTGPVVGPYCFYSFECPISSGTITVNGPINETLWEGDAPENLSANVTISASGLPSSSHFAVTLDSTHYTSSARSTLTVLNVTPGAHSVTNISATSATSGWEYFGAPSGPDPIVTPIETGVDLQFDSLVDVAAPAGNFSFHAPGLTAGTTWSVDFNQTTYTSSTPWINISAHPGTYLWSAGDAVSAGGSTGYVPTTSAGNISVTPGGVYAVGYASAYQIVVLSSTGGLASGQGGAPTNAQTFWEAGGATVHLLAQTSAGYSFGGWSGTGPGSYTGSSIAPSFVVSGPVVESASFIPLPGARFNLTVVAQGLPAGTWWTVNVGGVGYSSDNSSIVAGNLWPWGTGAPGHYGLDVPVVYQNSTNLTRFVPLGHPPVVGTNGTLTPPLVIGYSAQVFVQASGSAGGSVEETYLGAPVGTADWVPEGATLNISALTDPGYVFSGWVGTGAGSYTGPAALVQVTAAGPVSEVASFTPLTPPVAQHYSLTISLSTSVVPGTEWSVTFGGQGYSSSNSSLTIPDLATGTYGVQVNAATSPDGLTHYTATPADPAAYTVKANATIDVSYTDSYWVAVSASVGGSVSPGSGWYAAGSVLYLVATPNSTYSFSGWSGTGSGEYAGPNSTASLIVSGPLSEVATFSPSSAVAAATSIWQSPDTWIGLGAVGLIIGLAVGIIFARMGTRPASRDARTSPRSESASRGGGSP